MFLTFLYSANPVISMGNEVARVSKTTENWRKTEKTNQQNKDNLLKPKIARDPQSPLRDLACELSLLLFIVL